MFSVLEGTNRIRVTFFILNLLHKCIYISEPGHIKTIRHAHFFSNLSELTLYMLSATFWESFCTRENCFHFFFFFSYEFFPFREVSTLSNVTGQSISSEHRGREAAAETEIVQDWMRLWKTSWDQMFVCMCLLRMCTMSVCGVISMA